MLNGIQQFKTRKLRGESRGGVVAQLAECLVPGPGKPENLILATVITGMEATRIVPHDDSEGGLGGVLGVLLCRWFWWRQPKPWVVCNREKLPPGQLLNSGHKYSNSNTDKQFKDRHTVGCTGSNLPVNSLPVCFLQPEACLGRKLFL